MTFFKTVVPVTRTARETYPATTGAAGYTPSFSAESLLSPRRKRSLFRAVMLSAAKTALAASTITSNQYATILALYRHPWRKTTATGVMVDVLDLVRKDMNAAYHSSYSAYVSDWWPHVAWLAASGQMTTLLASITNNTPA